MFNGKGGSRDAVFGGIYRVLVIFLRVVIPSRLC